METGRACSGVIYLRCPRLSGRSPRSISYLIANRNRDIRGVPIPLMAVIVEFTIPSDSFPFGRSMSSDPNVTVSFEAVVPMEEKRIPFLWATNKATGNFDQFERTLRESEVVTSVEALTHVGDSVLYRVDWDTDEETFMNGVLDAHGTIIEGHASDAVAGSPRREHQSRRRRDHADRVRVLSASGVRRARDRNPDQERRGRDWPGDRLIVESVPTDITRGDVDGVSPKRPGASVELSSSPRAQRAGARRAFPSGGSHPRGGIRSQGERSFTAVAPSCDSSLLFPTPVIGWPERRLPLRSSPDSPR